MAADGPPPPQLQPRGRRNDCAVLTRLVTVAVVLTAALEAGGISQSICLDLKFPSTVFTVAITGVTGLDPVLLLWDVVIDDMPIDLAAAGPRRRLQQQQPTAPRPSLPPTLALISPVFNLTFQIDNRGNSVYDACVPGVSTAAVLYGDGAFFLAGGSVPSFCAGKEHRIGVAARARGENVTVPRVLAAKLAAGDASVDVKVTMPMYCLYGRCHGAAVLSCKPKIGGGTSPACRQRSANFFVL